MSPNETRRVEVYLNTHELLGNAETMNDCGPGNLTAPLSESDVEGLIMTTMGHETGHSVHVCHSEKNEDEILVSGCPGLQITGPIERSVMTNGVHLPIPRVTDTGAQYSETDSPQIRLRVVR